MNFSLQDRSCSNQMADSRFPIAVILHFYSAVYVNTPQQNGHIESFHKTLKKEYVWPHEFGDSGQAEITLLVALEDYNRHRIHSAIGYMTPNEFAARWEETKAKEVVNR